VQKKTGVRPLTLMSGYRAPEYNEALRTKGVRAAGGSLHTEGLAADVAFPKKILKPLWLDLRAMDCCGAGYYAKDGFLHIDVGRPRFWEPQTSRVEENLSAGNAKLFARTDYDRYRGDEPVVVSLHALTVPPVRIATKASWGEASPRGVTLKGQDGCLELTSTGQTVELAAVPPGRGRLVLSTCEPRGEKTPATVTTNAFEVR
ncbi:MAG TPA: DUF882 domain-containing protein, partial [Candidatus Binatia bacterium]|nr:DUF882 domain-containing protein [Candidatus Binatia bacterium]